MQYEAGAWEHMRRVTAMILAGEARVSTWWLMVVHDGTWWHVEHMLVRQKLRTRGGACEVVSGRSWLDISRDWLFCHSTPLF